MAASEETCAVEGVELCGSVSCTAVPIKIDHEEVSAPKYVDHVVEIYLICSAYSNFVAQVAVDGSY